MTMKGQSGWYLKIVERAGDSLVDLLHRSDPWSGEDCKRPTCLQCETKLKTGKNLTQDCSKRNCIYQTWCISCDEREKSRIEERAGDDEGMKKELMRKMKLFCYIGETSRSCHERSWEHVHSMEQLRTSSMH